MALPGWYSLSSVVEIHATLEAISVVFFVALVAFDLWAHLNKKHERLLERIGLICFAVAVLGEVCAYPYSRRLDTLSSEATAKLNKEAGDARKEAGVATKDAADARMRAASIEKASAELRKRAEDEATARVKIELYLAGLKSPRGVRWDTEMESLLRPFAGTPYTLEVFRNQESILLAQRVMTLLNLCGWKYKHPPPNLISGYVVLMESTTGAQAEAFETLTNGVHIDSSKGQFKASMAIAKWFELSDIYTDGIVGGLISDVVQPQEQLPMRVVIGEKNLLPPSRPSK